LVNSPQFCVTDMSVELQSQGKSIAELQVTGVRTSLTRRPYDTNIAMSVHSLLLVDALQTFGPNFELLVASHRHVMVDSVSGSLRGSEPVSPMSPGSPDPMNQAKYPTSAVDIKRALNSLQIGRPTSPPTLSARGGFASPRSPAASSFQSPPPSQRLRHASSAVRMDYSDPDALISIDVFIVSPNCPSIKNDETDDQEQLQIVTVQFNSLDVIANQGRDSPMFKHNS
jgi:vacuolar protein sorting-associated protein 13D